MATVNPVITHLANENAIKVVWTLTTANADGAPMIFLSHPNRTVYMLGTWGGATAQLQGGDGTTNVVLTDPQGNAISKTADGIERVDEVPEYVRPALTVAGAGATIVITVIARK